MRLLVPLLLAALSVSLAQLPARSRPEPFIPVGIWYGGGATEPPMVPRDPAKARDDWRRDLATIRSAGFNSVTSWVDWPSAEPERGTYDFAALEQILSLADDIGLRVIVRIHADAGPRWMGARYTDARVAGGGPPVFCADHPGIRNDRLAFVSAAARAASRHASFHAVELRADRAVAEVRSDTVAPVRCSCSYTLERLRAWSAQGADGSSTGRDRGLFDAYARQADLKDAVDAARRQGAPIVASYPDSRARSADDDRRTGAAADVRGARLDPRDHGTGRSAVGLTWPLDRLGPRATGWWLGELRTRAGVAAEDVRLWSWAAYARGARAISYAGFTVPEMIAADGRLTPAAKAAGDYAGNLARNLQLFAPMRPRPSRVALLDTDHGSPRAATGAPRGRVADAAAVFYRAMFAQNIHPDVIPVEELLAGAASKYAVVAVGDLAAAPAVDAALEAYERQGGTLLRDVSGDEPDVIARVQRAVSAAGVSPDIKIDGAAGLVDARFLESPEAFLLLAINYSETPQTVTMHFSPDTPEAIWQNMETGAAVHFVQRAEGPTYRHAFAARDVLVLVRGKRLR